MSASVSTRPCAHTCGCGPPKAWQGMAHTQIPLTQRPSSQILSLQDQRGPLGSLCLTCWTHKMFMEIGLNQHFRKLFNLMLKTSGNCKSTVSARDGLTQTGLCFTAPTLTYGPLIFIAVLTWKFKLPPVLSILWQMSLLESSGKAKGNGTQYPFTPSHFTSAFRNSSKLWLY